MARGTRFQPAQRQLAHLPRYGRRARLLRRNGAAAPRPALRNRRHGGESKQPGAAAGFGLCFPCPALGDRPQIPRRRSADHRGRHRRANRPHRRRYPRRPPGAGVCRRRNRNQRHPAQSGRNRTQRRARGRHRHRAPRRRCDSRSGARAARAAADGGRSGGRLVFRQPETQISRFQAA